MTIASAPPHSDVDLFSDEVLLDPYPVYARLREMGAAVRLDALDRVWALTRYDHIRAADGDWQTFSSDASVGLNEVINARLVGSILGSDPPWHDKLRAVLMAQLSPRSIRRITDYVEEAADRLVDSLVERGRFDAVPDLATVLPLTVVFDLIGLPESGRGNMIRWADAMFTIFGPLNDRTRAGVQIIPEMYEWLGTLQAEDLRPGSMGRSIFDVAGEQGFDHHQCVKLLATYVTAGMDTTINAISNAVALFAEHPDQWDAVRADPGLIPSAFNEVLRYESPVLAFARRVTRDVVIDGVEVPGGDQVVLLFGSGNRDERHYPDPDRFDVRRNPVDHLSFGYGIHTCAGQALARIEGHAILRALSERIRRFHTGEPKRHLNNVVRGLESLPVEIET
ncbi:Cytochrome P450 [Pseudonocardia thermophila]|jgi:Cytochrome P450|uniref:Cytochrome P450 n=1 Tax=Pseudonocardia thermophila TaxID=1848 RepID=A0A1M6UXY2_PSETH|nr:cytochrome P450 [Pseudonocardia thermophila]SHK74014.1 Cytochrome P450 [Pseudonocardia thermophila]